MDRDLRRLRAVVGLGTGDDFNSILCLVEAAEPRLALFVRISRSAQLSGDFLAINLLAATHGSGKGVDFCRVAEDRSAESAVDDAIVLYVEVGEYNRHRDGNDQEHNQRGTQYRIARQPCPGCAAAYAVLIFRDSKLNSHALVGGNTSASFSDDGTR